MKLLFDHNISPKLVEHLADLFPGSDHVFALRLHTSDDQTIRSFAADNDFLIVTKDADYGEMHMLFGAPPKVIWIRRGNCSTNAVEQMLRDHIDDIIRLVEDESLGILSIY